MASIDKPQRGTWIAYWYRGDGSRRNRTTGTYDREEAQRLANRMEAEDRFWWEQDRGTWEMLAQLNYSPKYLHFVFTHSRHLRFERFRQLLVEAGVRLAKPKDWRDRPRQSTPNAKRYRWRGRMLSLPEIVEDAGSGIRLDTVTYRLRTGWQLAKAVTTPPMSHSEAGRIGAEKSNRKR